MTEAFTTSPVLTIPDPQCQLVVEVNASCEGVRAVLSQQSDKDNRIHLCAYLSRKLSPAESKYDVGNWELLAVKTPLEEWRHWLEGVEHLFLVLTDHKNLEYMKKAKRLNSRQVFSRFRFTLSFRPGSQNTKLDALSHMFEPEPATKEPETILPLDCVVGWVSWQIPGRVPQQSVVRTGSAAAPGPSVGTQFITHMSPWGQTKQSPVGLLHPLDVPQ